MRARGSCDLNVVERNGLEAEAALPRRAAAGVMNQQPSRQSCCNREKVGTILPGDSSLVVQSQVHVVGYRCGAQGVAGAFTAELPRGDSSQFGVNGSEQGVGRGLVSRVPPVKNLRNIALFVHFTRLPRSR